MSEILYRGDDTDAFGNDFIEIELEDAPQVISKAELRCGDIVKVIENPTFPLHINFTAEETNLMKQTNDCSFAIFDEQGRKLTCDGGFSFPTQCRKV